MLVRGNLNNEMFIELKKYNMLNLKGSVEDIVMYPMAVIICFGSYSLEGEQAKKKNADIFWKSKKTSKRTC